MDMYERIVKDLSMKLGKSGILKKEVYLSLFKEIRTIRKHISGHMYVFKDKSVSVNEKYEAIQKYNELVIDFLSKLAKGLDSRESDPNALLAPIGYIAEEMIDAIPKYAKEHEVFSTYDITAVAGGVSQSFNALHNVSFFLTDLIAAVHFTDAYVSILLNESLLTLSYIQEATNEVMFQVFEQLQNNNDQINKMNQDLEAIKERLGLS